MGSGPKPPGFQFWLRCLRALVSSLEKLGLKIVPTSGFCGFRYVNSHKIFRTAPGTEELLQNYKTVCECASIYLSGLFFHHTPGPTLNSLFSKMVWTSLSPHLCCCRTLHKGCLPPPKLDHSPSRTLSPLLPYNIHVSFCDVSTFITLCISL